MNPPGSLEIVRDLLADLPAFELALCALLASLFLVLSPGLATPPAERPGRRIRDLGRDERAWALLDFTLVLPILLTLVLVIAQVALLLHARIVTSYCAYAAARSAVVWLEEGRDLAAERAERAAAVACTAIASDDVAFWEGVEVALPVAPLYVHSPDDFFRRMMRGGKKLAYSRRSTRAELILPSGPLGPHDPVTAVVEHDFHLTIPYADGIFRSGRGHLGVPVRTLRASHTLTNEGRVETR